MNSLKMNLRIAALAAACFFSASSSSAAPTYYSGTFQTDDAQFIVNFNLAASGTLNAFTSSYAQGGFAPVLTLFGAAGGTQQVAGSASDPAACPAGGTEFCWDAALSTHLDAGDYTLVLTQDGNYAAGEALSDGFTLDGMIDYTSWFNLGVGGGRCINVDASQRSCNFGLTVDLALDAVGDGGGSVPEPGSLALFGAALLAAARLRRRA
jgi:hypothetical protein